MFFATGVRRAISALGRRGKRAYSAATAQAKPAVEDTSKWRYPPGTPTPEQHAENVQKNKSFFGFAAAQWVTGLVGGVTIGAGFGAKYPGFPAWTSPGKQEAQNQ